MFPTSQKFINRFFREDSSFKSPKIVLHSIWCRLGFETVPAAEFRRPKTCDNPKEQCTGSNVNKAKFFSPFLITSLVALTAGDLALSLKNDLKNDVSI